MAFLAPIIGAVTGLGLVGQAIIGVGLSLGASYLANRLRPKAQNGAAPPGGVSLSLRLESNESRQFAFGTIASEGSLKYHNVYGPNGNDYVQLVFALADHECEDVLGCWVDGRWRTFGSHQSTSDVEGYRLSGYDGYIWVEPHLGAWGQAADADLVAHALGDPWASANRGRGVCYVRVTVKYSPDKFPNGLPSFRWKFKGAKLYDWRKDSTAGGSGAHRWGVESTYEWTPNPVVIRYNFRRGITTNGIRLCGMNTPALAMPLPKWTAAANVCEEAVARKAGGTEWRYQAHGIFECASDHDGFLRDLSAAIGGEEIDSGGVFVPLPGAAGSVVASLTDGDLIARSAVEYTPRLGQAELVNAVFGSFSDPANLYEQSALPPRISPTDALEDGGAELHEHYSLAYVTSHSQGQRILEIFRRRNRYQRKVSCRLRSRFALLEAGDWITWTSSRYGFSAMTFEVEQVVLARDLTVSVVLREVATGIFSWTASTDELDPESPKPVGAGGSTFTTLDSFALANVDIVAGGGAATRPGLRATWSPVTDPTVTGVEIVFRRVGDTVELPVPTVLDPSTGACTWATSVQGDTIYEARARPIVQPARAVAWTGWATSGTATEPQVVAVAAFAQTVDPEGLPPAELDAQSQKELELVTAVDTVAGSLAGAVKELRTELDAIARASMTGLLTGTEAKARVSVERSERISAQAALAEQITTTIALIGSNAASIEQRFTAQAGINGATAQALETLTTVVDGQAVTVSILQTSIGGIEGRIGMAVNANGHLVGLVQLDGSALGSNLTIVADYLKIARSDITGGDPVPVFALGEVDGVTKLVLRGDMVADGGISARHLDVVSLSAISANIGDVIAGTIRNADSSVIFDVTNMRLYRPDGRLDFDMKNLRFRMTV